MNLFRLVTMIARITPGTRNPRISAQTVANRLREIGEIQCMFYIRRFFFDLVYVLSMFVVQFYKVFIIYHNIYCDLYRLLVTFANSLVLVWL